MIRYKCLVSLGCVLGGVIISIFIDVWRIPKSQNQNRVGSLTKPRFMKKFIKNASLCASVFSALLFSLHTQALTIPSGSTVTLSNLNMVENVIVESGGLLIIDGNLTFGHPNPLVLDKYYILVKNGGRAYSNSGSCSGLTVGGVTKAWQGFIIEPTTKSNPSPIMALQLYDFLIEDADNAIELPGTIPGVIVKGGFINRPINVISTTFVNNSNHVAGGTGGFSFGAGMFTNSNRDNGIYQINFVNCDFANSSGMWPIWMVNYRNILFDGCSINNGVSAGHGLHFNSIRDMQILNCEFIESYQTGMVFHGGSYDIDISNNTFSPSTATGSYYTGIGLGHQTNSGAMFNCTIEGNTFQGPSGSPSRNGIGLGEISTFGSTYGQATNLFIRNNTFDNLEHGMGLFNTATGSPYVQVKGNSFDDCQTGIQLDRNASNTYVYCNTFTGGATAFKITNDAGTSDVKDWDFEDPNNQFIGVTLCIDNQSTDPLDLFEFHTNLGNPNPPYSFAGNVLGSSSLTINSCGKSQENGDGKQLSSENIENGSVFPNPSDGVFNVKFDDTENKNTIEVLDAMGRTVYFEITEQSQISIDLSNENSGVYILRLTNLSGMKVERIVLK